MKLFFSKVLVYNDKDSLAIRRESAYGYRQINCRTSDHTEYDKL